MTVWVVLTSGSLNTIFADRDRAMTFAREAHPVIGNDSSECQEFNPIERPGDWFVCGGVCKMVVAEWIVLGSESPQEPSHAASGAVDTPA